MVFNERRLHRHNYNEPGHAHELTFSCYHRFPFLARDRTRKWLIDSINKARVLLEFDVWAWVIMPEHVHLIVYPRRERYDIADIRRLIKEPVANKAIRYITRYAPEWLPKIQRIRGNRVEYLFWQSGGGYDRNITEGETLMMMIDYIHNNPVRRELVHLAHDWKWSSAGWFLDMRDAPLMPDRIPPQWLLAAGLGPLKLFGFCRLSCTRCIVLLRRIGAPATPHISYEDGPPHDACTCIALVARADGRR